MVSHEDVEKVMALLELLFIRSGVYQLNIFLSVMLRSRLTVCVHASGYCFYYILFFVLL